MAQACVLRCTAERNTQPSGCLREVYDKEKTPDMSIITSSPRKRRNVVTCAENQGAGKSRRMKSEPTINSPRPVLKRKSSKRSKNASPGKNHVIFSPPFEASDKVEDAGEAKATVLEVLEVNLYDAASTDVSTGTSASLEHNDRALLPSSVHVDYSPTSPSVDDDSEREEWDFNPFSFIKSLPPLTHCVPPRTTFLLPRQTRHSKKKTLVLDLDETLVHSCLGGDCSPDFTFTVKVGMIEHKVAVRVRPHLQTFLARVADLFEVVVFTASQQVYAQQLLDIIDPTRSLIRHRIYRDSCVVWEGNYLKDLTVLGRDLAHTIIIDNSPQAFGFQVSNGIPIESWYDDINDVELLKLLPFLEKAARVEDVRPLIEAEFALQSLIDAASPI